MKRLAILNYLFIFDPTETGFTSGSQFEAYLADFCSAYGMEASVVETAGSGTKAIYISKLQVAPTLPGNAKSNDQIRKSVQQIQSKAPTKDFKKFVQPKNYDTQPPKAQFVQGKTNRQKLRGGY